MSFTPINSSGIQEINPSSSTNELADSNINQELSTGLSSKIKYQSSLNSEQNVQTSRQIALTRTELQMLGLSKHAAQTLKEGLNSIYNEVYAHAESDELKGIETRYNDTIAAIHEAAKPKTFLDKIRKFFHCIAEFISSKQVNITHTNFVNILYDTANKLKDSHPQLAGDLYEKAAHQVELYNASLAVTLYEKAADQVKNINDEQASRCYAQSELIKSQGDHLSAAEALLSRSNEEDSLLLKSILCRGAGELLVGEHNGEFKERFGTSLLGIMENLAHSDIDSDALSKAVNNVAIAAHTISKNDISNNVLAFKLYQQGWALIKANNEDQAARLRSNAMTMMANIVNLCAKESNPQTLLSLADQIRSVNHELADKLCEKAQGLKSKIDI